MRFGLNTKSDPITELLFEYADKNQLALRDALLAAQEEDIEVKGLPTVSVVTVAKYINKFLGRKAVIGMGVEKENSMQEAKEKYLDLIKLMAALAEAKVYTSAVTKEITRKGIEFNLEALEALVREQFKENSYNKWLERLADEEEQIEEEKAAKGKKS